jgi:hypothetical protein
MRSGFGIRAFRPKISCKNGKVDNTIFHMINQPKNNDAEAIPEPNI